LHCALRGPCRVLRDREPGRSYSEPSTQSRRDAAPSGSCARSALRATALMLQPGPTPLQGKSWARGPPCTSRGGASLESPTSEKAVAHVPGTVARCRLLRTLKSRSAMTDPVSGGITEPLAVAATADVQTASGFRTVDQKCHQKVSQKRLRDMPPKARGGIYHYCGWRR